MNKKFTLLLVSLVTTAFLATSPSVQAQEPSIAIVDVPQIVSASPEVQALKKEQQTKADELIKFIENARKDIASITDAKKKKTAEDKYTKELQTKKEKLDNEYATKLKALDASISKKIEDLAKAQGYDIVLSKSIVLYGGNDITNDIIKIMK